MNNIRSLTVSITSFIVLITCAFVCSAASMSDWENDREKVFKLAKEQDKFIVLFVGRPTCPISQGTYTNFTDPAGPLKKMLDDNYIVWYSHHDDTDSQAEVSVYTEEILIVARYLPLLVIINPDEPGKVVKSLWGMKTVDQLQSFLTVDLFSGIGLKWRTNKDEVFKLAKDLSKFIFKFEGKSTSADCHKVMKQLNTNPLKKLLEDNYILWYCDFNPDDYAGVKLLAGDDENTPVKAPSISIIYFKEPDNLIDRVWGYRDVGTLQEMLKSHTVSNGIIAPKPKVTVRGNVLHISNLIHNEQIEVFTLTGQRIASIRKNTDTFTIDASYFPKGTLVVSGSSGWSAKIIVQ